MAYLQVIRCLEPAQFGRFLELSNSCRLITDQQSSSVCLFTILLDSIWLFEEKKIAVTPQPRKVKVSD